MLDCHSININRTLYVPPEAEAVSKVAAGSGPALLPPAENDILRIVLFLLHIFITYFE